MVLLVWQFDKEVAEDVNTFQCHPKQIMEDQKDGTLIVRFRTGGFKEMCWHLFTWGKHVKILAPQELEDYYEDMIDTTVGNS